MRAAPVNAAIVLGVCGTTRKKGPGHFRSSDNPKDPRYAPDRPSYICVMSELNSAKVDRTAFSTGFLPDASDEKAYWLSKAPYERLEATEPMRQIVYGYDPATCRLQKVLEITQRPQG